MIAHLGSHTKPDRRLEYERIYGETLGVVGAIVSFNLNIGAEAFLVLEAGIAIFAVSIWEVYLTVRWPGTFIEVAVRPDLVAGNCRVSDRILAFVLSRSLIILVEEKRVLIVVSMT